MEWLKAWVSGICAAAVLVSLAKAVAPQNPAGKCVQLVGAMIIVLAVISPFRTLSIADILTFDKKYSVEYEKISRELQEGNEKIQATIIEDKMSTYILERAHEIGIDCDEAYMEVGKNDEGYLYLKSAKMVIDRATDKGKLNELKRVVIQECGIPENELIIQLKGG